MRAALLGEIGRVVSLAAEGAAAEARVEALGRVGASAFEEGERSGRRKAAAQAEELVKGVHQSKERELMLAVEAAERTRDRTREIGPEIRPQGS